MSELIQTEEQKYQLKVIPDLSVVNQLTYERVVNFRNIAVEKRKLVEDTFNPIVEKNHAAWKQAISTRAKFLDPIVQTITFIDSNIRHYKSECERKQREEQERLRKEAEAKAAMEKAKLEKKAEVALEKGDENKAEQLLQKVQLVEAVTPLITPNFEKVKGDTTRKTYRAEVIDVKLLPEMYKIPDQKTLDAIARSSKGTMQIPGVRMICE